MSLKGKKILVGLTGGIAAYKTPSLIRLLRKSGIEVRAVMTAAATKFITPLTIETVSQNPVAMEMFPQDRFVGTHHIGMAEWPDLIVIAPATANFIGKIASGICDDLLTTVICASKKPVMFAPAMNTNMYLNPITRKNLEYLKSLGYIFIEPGEGELACDTSGKGRLAEPEEIFNIIQRYFQKKKLLTDKKVLVTAGPCREAIDPVRFMSNRSSGKMGYAIAMAAKEAGAAVTLISGPTNLSVEAGIELIRVESTEEMYRAVKNHFSSCDILIMAAAPADFTVKSRKFEKIKKGSSQTLVLSPTIDILNSLKGSKKKSQRVIGFALETENGLKNAAAKLKEKDMDMIVLNQVEDGIAFDSDNNKVALLYKNGRTEQLEMMSKRKLGELLIEKIIGL